MHIYKATNTLDGYLPELSYTEDKSLADVILVGGKKFDLADFPNLKGVFKTGVGTDNLPFEQAQKLGVQIVLPSTETCNIIYDETAAFTCHLILTALYAGCGEWDSWKKLDRPLTRSRKLLVIGTGKIGGRVVEKMQKLVTVTTFDAANNAEEELEGKIREADCVSLHIPLMPATQSYFDAIKLSWMKDGASLVNTARGPVIDEDALFSELASGRLRAACDVFWQEPYDGKLIEFPADRFIRSPHIASTCRDFLEGTAQDFLKFLEELK